MGLSGMSPRNLAKGYASAMKSPLAKILDWILAIAFVGYTVYLFVTEWPSPSLWAWLCIPLAVVGIVMSSIDWKSRVESLLHRSMSRRRR